MSDDDLYSLRVETWRGEQIAQLTGSRETLLDVAMRVMLDYAPAWDPAEAGYPQFRVFMMRFKR